MSWLEYHKKKWQLQRGQRKERKQLLAHANRNAGSEAFDISSASSTSVGLSGFLRQRSRALVELPWQLIQVPVVMSKCHMKFQIFMHIFISICDSTMLHVDCQDIGSWPVHIVGNDW